MKKLLLSLGLCVLLCGCGNKLTCTLEDEDKGTAKYVISFKNDKAVKGNNSSNSKRFFPSNACYVYIQYGSI